MFSKYTDDHLPFNIICPNLNRLKNQRVKFDLGKTNKKPRKYAHTSIKIMPLEFRKNKNLKYKIYYKKTGVVSSVNGFILVNPK